MKKIKNLDILVPLVITACLFSILYFPTLNRPYHFEEIKVTKLFHGSPPNNSSVFNSGVTIESRWGSLWRDYLEISPPGLLYFYRLWSFATKENEILMRLPLLLLTGLCLYQLFFFFRELSSPSEAAVIILFTSLSTWWYGLGSLLIPSSFTLLFATLSICLYSQSFSQNKINRWLFITNLCGLAVSYYFIFLVLVQILCSLLFKKTRGIKSFFIFHLIFILISSATLYWTTDTNITNSFTRHWGKVDNKDPLFLYEYLLLGRVQERKE